MLYTGVETLDGTKIERVGYATSSDGIALDEAGRRARSEPHRVCERRVGHRADGASRRRLDPSRLDERRRPQRPHARRARLDVHIRLRDRRSRGSRAAGRHTSSATPRRRIATSARSRALRPETASRSWMSFLQPYSANGDEFWSDYFPVTVAGPERGSELPAHRARRPLAGAPLGAGRRARAWTRSS